MRTRASNPFTLGVASGNPKDDSVVLWTRLAPVPLSGGGMGTAGGVEIPLNLLRNSDATSDKTPLPRLFFLFALRPYQLSLPKCR